ncbi:MAG: sugar ABC transporter ATP-binding protein, partial [Actinomycetes bacterium]
TGLTPRGAIRSGIEVIHQDLSLFPNLTVSENIAIAPYVAQGRAWVRAREVRKIARDAMAIIGVALPLDVLVEQLPVADRQITAICRSLALRSRVLVMDEPTAALAWHEVDALLTVITRLRDTGVAVVFVSHKLNEVTRIADDITVLRDGMVVTSGPAGKYDRESISRAMTGREIVPLTRTEGIEATSIPRLELSSLSSRGAFQDVSLVLHPGEVIGLAGLVGSGRAEVVETVFGLRPVQNGEIYVDGTHRSIRNVDDAMAAGIGYVPGDRLTEGLFLRHSVERNIVAASTDDLPRRFGIISPRSVAGIAKTLIAQLQIKTSSRRTPVLHLSGGNQQRVVLAKWFVRQPRILLLNGPTVGVDVGSREEILNLLQQLSTAGTSIIIASDDEEELVQICHRVLIMRGGRIAEEMTGAEVTTGAILGALTS